MGRVDHQTPPTIPLAEVVRLVSAAARKTDASASFPMENLDLLRRSGLLGSAVPVSEGGDGASLRQLTDTAFHLGGACLSTALIWAMHTQQVDALVRYAEPPLRGDVLSAIGRGECYLASVTTEVGKGGYLLNAEDVSPATDTGWLIDRYAPVVTGARAADAFLVTTRLGENSSESDVSLVYVDATHATVADISDWSPMGMRGTESVAVQLTAQVTERSIVGAPGGFREIALECMIPLAHLLWSACWLGSATSALGDMAMRVRSRDRARRLDPRSDLLAARLGRVRLDLELVKSQLEVCLVLIERCRASDRSTGERPVQIALNALKIGAAEKSFSAVDLLVEMAGFGDGYFGADGGALERSFRDLRSASLNYSNDRLLATLGAFSLLDRGGGLHEEPEKSADYSPPIGPARGSRR